MKCRSLALVTNNVIVDYNSSPGDLEPNVMYLYLWSGRLSSLHWDGVGDRRVVGGGCRRWWAAPDDVIEWKCNWPNDS